MFWWGVLYGAGALVIFLVGCACGVAWVLEDYAEHVPEPRMPPFA